MIRAWLLLSFHRSKFTELPPDIPKEDVDFLELSSPKDALLFSIVTLRGTAAPQ